MFLSSLGSALLGDLQPGSDGVASSPSITWNGPSTGNAGNNALFVVTYNNPTVDVTWTVTSNIGGDVVTRAVQTTSIANPVLDLELTGPTALGDHTLSIMNDGGLSNPPDLIYTVLAVSGATSQLGSGTLGGIRLGADVNAWVAGVSQLYLRPPAITHGIAGQQSRAFVVGILNPNAGDTHVVMSNAGGTGTWSSGATLNNATREAIVYFTPDAGTSGIVTVSAIGDNGVGAPPESVLYTVDGNTFYIATSGSDLNNGQSMLTPWATAAKVNSYGVARGGVYNWNGGDSFTGVSFTVSDGVSGADADDLITFQAYGSGVPTLSQSNSTTHPFHWVNSGGLLVTGMKLQGSGTTQATTNQYGVRVEVLNTGLAARENVSVTNCEFLNLKGGMRQTCYSPVTGTTFTGNEVHACWYFGIITEGAGVGDAGTLMNAGLNVSSNHFHHIDGNINPGENRQSYGGAFLGVSSFTCSNNLVHDIGGTSVAGAGALWCAFADDGTFEDNEIYNIAYDEPSSYAGDGSGIDIDAASSNIKVRFNYVHDCEGQGITVIEYASGQHPTGERQWQDNEVSFNVVQNCGTVKYGAFSITGDTMRRCKVFHNTFVHTYGGVATNSIIFTNPTASNISEFEFYNNIVLGDTTGIKLINIAAATGLTAASFKWGTNLLYTNAGAEDIVYPSGTYSSVSAWQSANSGTVTGSLHADPELNNAFVAVTLDNPSLIGSLSNFTASSSGSPVAGAGLDLTAAPYSIGGIVDTINDKPASYGGVYDIGAAKLIASANAAARSYYRRQGVIA